MDINFVAGQPERLGLSAPVDILGIGHMFVQTFA